MFEIDDESMKYKKVIIKSKHDTVSGITKEHVLFSTQTKKFKVSFVFNWAYDKYDGFSYKQLEQFSGHKRYNEEEQKWLENYCKENYPDGHHMSY